jgi:hypothetical protein
MSKHFLCCIPVRFGVLIMSLSMLLLSVVSAGVSGFLLHVILNGSNDERFRDIDVPKGYKITLGAAAAVNVLIALCSLFGFIGAIIRKRAFVKTYSAMLWFFWGANLGISVTVIVALSLTSTRDKLSQLCDKIPEETLEHNPDAIQDCKDWIARFRQAKTLIPFIILTVLSLLWHLYGCIIVSRYVKQLEQEQGFNRDGFKAGTKSFYPHDTLPQTGDREPLNAPKSYPYTDPHNSFSGGGKHAV